MEQQSVRGSTLVLFATFAILVLLAIVGTFLRYIWQVETDLFKEAMRMIGGAGPAATAIQSGADIIKSRSTSASIRNDAGTGDTGAGTSIKGWDK